MRRKLLNRLARGEIRQAWQEFSERLPKEHLINQAFDQRHGTETADEIRLEETGVSPEDAARGRTIYRPVWESEFHAALTALEIGFEGFTFVDIGSGKGKMMLMASDYPFSQIVGVEYSPGLHAIAERNLAVYRSPQQRCFDLQPILGDALQYRFPAGPIVCVVFNALDAETMRAFAKVAERDLASRSDPAYLVYSNLRHVAELGDGLDGIVLLKRLISAPKLVVFGNTAAALQHQRAKRSLR